jgi:DNA-binding response OmpR family regulator
MATVLLVEDDSLLGRLIGGYFTHAGFDFMWSTHADQMWEALEAKKVDLILMDINLPGINGLDLLKQLKQNDKYKNIPVVMLTNLGETENINVAMGYGAKDYIIKSNIELGDLVELTRSRYLN